MSSSQAPPATNVASRSGVTAMRVWLIVLAFMVYAMILIGGATRLTDSGLSITEWAPIHGALPPLSEQAWIDEFGKYKLTAEYRLQNAGMTMAEFQFIYWWEWGHRLFGRLIGLVAIGGFVWFAANRWLTRKWAVRFAVLIALGGLQGFVGWWMVASGIGETTRVDVAPYRLATHFTLALLIIGLIAWFWMDLGGKARAPASSRLRYLAYGLLALVSIQMFTGALVAGLDAGRTYTDWPQMAGEWVPSHYVENQLGLRSLFEGRAATQFNHRILAYGLFALALVVACAYRRSPQAGPVFWVAGLVTAQSVWGVVTLLNGAQPLPIPLVHQGLGVLVLLAAVRLAWRVSPGYSASAESPPASTNTTLSR
ncbi:MAG: COX15/CtaA family protein [Pseudomonadota bacterium]